VYKAANALRNKGVCGGTRKGVNIKTEEYMTKAQRSIALGFLFTYTALLSFESDFAIARERPIAKRLLRAEPVALIISYHTRGFVEEEKNGCPIGQPFIYKSTLCGVVVSNHSDHSSD